MARFDWKAATIFCKNPLCSGRCLAANGKILFVGQMNDLGKRFPGLRTFQCPHCDTVRTLNHTQKGLEDLSEERVGRIQWFGAYFLMAIGAFLLGSIIDALVLHLFAAGAMLAAVFVLVYDDIVNHALPQQMSSVFWGCVGGWLFGMGTVFFFNTPQLWVAIWELMGVPFVLPPWWNEYRAVFAGASLGPGIVLTLCACARYDRIKETANIKR